MTLSDWTRDTPAPGLVVPQPRKGFRYGSEAFWLVGLATEHGVPATALDLGTGSGIMALLLARLGANVEAVDVRPEWRAGWDAAIAESALKGGVDFRTADVRDVAVGPPVDCVVSNPPFFAAGTGPTPEDGWRSAARFESTATVGAFVGVACGRLSPVGSAWFVVPVEREGDLLAAVPTGFFAARVVRVGGRRVIVELRTSGRKVTAYLEDPSQRVLLFAAGAVAASSDPARTSALMSMSVFSGVALVATVTIAMR